MNLKCDNVFKIIKIPYVIIGCNDNIFIITNCLFKKTMGDEASINR